MSKAGAIGLGSLASVWRYPVKSMLGEELNAAEVTERGLLGDRAYALVDSADGKAATAKNPRKWPRLFDFRAAFTEPVRAGAKLPPIRISLPARRRDGSAPQHHWSLRAVRDYHPRAGGSSGGSGHPAHGGPAQPCQRRCVCRRRPGRHHPPW